MNPPPLLSVVQSNLASRKYVRNKIHQQISLLEFCLRISRQLGRQLHGMHHEKQCISSTHIYVCILSNSNCQSNHGLKETMKISTNSQDHMKKKLISLLKTRDAELTSTFYLHCKMAQKICISKLQKSMWCF
jgi:hypothetical protein